MVSKRVQILEAESEIVVGEKGEMLVRAKISSIQDE